MAYPKQTEVELPLLRVLEQLGGEALPQHVYPKVASFFPNLTAEDQERRMESKPSAHKWWNLVQWARQTLVGKGQIDGATPGVWKLTDFGRARLRMARDVASTRPQPTPEQASTESEAGAVTLRDLANQSRDDAKA